MSGQEGRRHLIPWAACLHQLLYAHSLIPCYVRKKEILHLIKSPRPLHWCYGGVSITHSQIPSWHRLPITLRINSPVLHDLSHSISYHALPFFLHPPHEPSGMFLEQCQVYFCLSILVISVLWESSSSRSFTWFVWALSSLSFLLQCHLCTKVLPWPLHPKLAPSHSSLQWFVYS